MLVTLKQILGKAHRGHYAVGAFNVNNLEMIQAVMLAAEAEKSPAIMSTSEGAIHYAGMEELGALAHLAANRSKRAITFHLDHGKNVELIKKAIRSGLYGGVMFDGSSLPYEENVATTKELVALAHKTNVSVEAELGAIAGIEDFVTVEDRDANLTDFRQAVEFVKSTGCDALAIAVGTRHGAYKYKGKSVLDYARIKKIASVVKIPLVLHGASGVPENVKKVCIQYGCDIEDAKGVSDASIRKAVSLGINKVNIDTDLRIAFDAGVRKFLHDNPKVIDPREILKPATELIAKVVSQKMRLLGSSGKA